MLLQQPCHRPRNRNQRMGRQPMQITQTQHGIGKLHRPTSSRHRKKLTQTVKQVQQKLAFDRTYNNIFVKSQKLWQTWIETECAPADPHHHSAHVPVLIAACESNKMRARERHLRQKFALNQNIAQHTVVAGDTLSAIALKNKISVEKLKILNHLRDDKIIVGQILVLAHPVFDLRDDNGVSMQEFGKE